MLHSKRLTRALFLIYLALLAWIILFKMDLPFSNLGTMKSLNLVPYAAPTRINGEVVHGEMMLNVLIFIPLGIYLEALFKKWHLLGKVLFIYFVSLSFETLQYVLEMGAADITDIIHNVLGGLIGIMLFKIITKIHRDDKRTQRLLNISASLVTIIVIISLTTIKSYII